MLRTLSVCLLLVMVALPHSAYGTTTGCQTFNQADNVWSSPQEIGVSASVLCWTITDGQTLTIKRGTTVTVGELTTSYAIEVQNGGKLVIEPNVHFTTINEPNLSGFIYVTDTGILQVGGEAGNPVRFSIQPSSAGASAVVGKSVVNGQFPTLILKHVLIEIAPETPPVGSPSGVVVAGGALLTMDHVAIHGLPRALYLHGVADQTWKLSNLEIVAPPKLFEWAVQLLGESTVELSDSTLNLYDVGVRVTQSVTLVAEGNRFTGGSLQLYADADATLTATRNRFLDYTDRGIGVKSQLPATITHNLFRGASANAAVEITGMATLAFNTVVAASLSDRGLECAKAGCVFTGNLVHGHKRGILYDSTTPAVLTENNISAAQDCAYQDILGSCVANPNPQGTEHNGTVADPQFVDAPGGDYRLKPGSPLVDYAAHTLDFGALDLEGNSRDLNPAGEKNKLDLGAFETPGADLFLPSPNVARNQTLEIALEGRNLTADLTIEVITASDDKLDQTVTVSNSLAEIGSGTQQHSGVNTLLRKLSLTLTKDAPLGARHLRIWRVASATPFMMLNAFTVTRAMKFAVTEPILPATGEQSETVEVKITGEDFPTEISDIIVIIGDHGDGVDVSVLGVNAQGTEITLEVVLSANSKLGKKDITVIDTAGNTSVTLAEGFSVRTHPVISSVSPTTVVKSNAGTVTYDVTIKGSGFVSEGLTVKLCSDGFNAKTTIVAAAETIIVVQLEVTPSSLVGTCFPAVINADGGNDTWATALTILQNAPPDPPQVTTPTLNGDGSFESNDGSVAVQTGSDNTPLPDTSWTITCTYALNGDFENPVEVVSASNGKCTPDSNKLSDNTTYGVKVTVVDSGGAGSETTIALFYNPTNNPPTLPVPQSPADGAVLTTLTPALTFIGAVDPDNDTLTYDIQVSQAGSGLPVVELKGLVAKSTQIQSALLSELKENTAYTWRVRAVDEHGLAGEWSLGQRFRIDVTNEAPSVPTLIAPVNGVAMRATEVGFVFGNVSDVDGDPLGVEFQLATDATFTDATSVTLKASEYAVHAPGEYVFHRSDLVEDTRYYWRIRLSDGDTTGDWSLVGEFLYSAVNNGPTPPTANSPKGDLQLTVSRPTFEVSNTSVDLEGDGFTFEIELYRQSDLPPITTAALTYRAPLTPIQVLKGIPVDAGAVTIYRYTGTLPSGAYAWRVRAVDQLGQAGEWSPYHKFSIKLEVEGLAGSDIRCSFGLAQPQHTNGVWLIMALLCALGLRQRRTRGEA